MFYWRGCAFNKEVLLEEWFIFSWEFLLQKEGKFCLQLIKNKSNMIFLSDLHTLNWSSTNIVAAALGSEVYLWNANNSSITLLMTAEQEQYVSGISWITDGSILGVGLSGGSVQVGCSLRPVCKPLDSESFKIYFCGNHFMNCMHFFLICSYGM